MIDTYNVLESDVACPLTLWPPGDYILKSDLGQELSVLFYYSETDK